MVIYNQFIDLLYCQYILIAEDGCPLYHFQQSVETSHDNKNLELPFSNSHIHID